MSREEKLLALDDSIAHWERVLSGEDRLIDSAECALCAKFLTREMRCPRCPLTQYGMRCGGHESPWRRVNCYASVCVLSEKRYWHVRTADTIKVMLTALLFVREAVRTEEE